MLLFKDIIFHEF